ncbi:hypothetical protein PWT90_09154 [Aphanocladium album]|nr:hypothetical protein PWT90_09154 [Aphanocladium album]
MAPPGHNDRRRQRAARTHNRPGTPIPTSLYDHAPPAQTQADMRNSSSRYRTTSASNQSIQAALPVQMDGRYPRTSQTPGPGHGASHREQQPASRYSNRSRNSGHNGQYNGESSSVRPPPLTVRQTSIAPIQISQRRGAVDETPVSPCSSYGPYTGESPSPVTPPLMFEQEFPAFGTSPGRDGLDDDSGVYAPPAFAALENLRNREHHQPGPSFPREANNHRQRGHGLWSASDSSSLSGDDTGSRVPSPSHSELLYRHFPELRTQNMEASFEAGRQDRLSVPHNNYRDGLLPGAPSTCMPTSEQPPAPPSAGLARKPAQRRRNRPRMDIS